MTKNVDDQLILYEIEKQVIENKLQYEIIENQLTQTEQQLQDIVDMLVTSKAEYQQSVMEVQSCRIETQETKKEFNELRVFSEENILNLNDKLDQLIEMSEDVNYEKIGQNVQLVLDQYIQTKFGNQITIKEEIDIVEEEGEDEEYQDNPQVEILPDGLIRYSLAKDVQTVEQIWTEYSHGVHGGPSIHDLEKKFDKRWRHRNENSTFLRRKKIFKAIEFAIEKLGYTERELIEEMENHRFDEILNKKKLMYWLYDNIPKKFKPN